MHAHQARKSIFTHCSANIAGDYMNSLTVMDLSSG
jgi:hypothetical protein